MNKSSTLSIFLLSIFVFLTIGAEAQAKKNYKRHGSKLDIRLGARAGILSSNFGGDEFLVEYDVNNLDVYPAVTYDSKTGFMGGLYADIRLSEKLIVQPEINFALMGTSMSRDVDLTNEDGAYIPSSGSVVSQNLEFVTIDKSLNYLQIPILFKFPLTREIHFSVGPQISFKMGEKTELSATSLDTIPDPFPFIDLESSSLFKNGDIGMNLGILYQMRNGFNVNLRWNRNFKNINKNEGFDLLTREPRNNNQAIVFTLGYTALYSKRLKEDIGRRH